VAVVQYTYTHKQYKEQHKTNNTYNTKIRKGAGHAPSLRVLPWHLPYNWGKIWKNLRCISLASFTRRSMYPHVLSNIEVPLKSIQWPVLELFSATLDFSGWCRLWCFLFLGLVVPHTFNVWSQGTFCSWNKTSTWKLKPPTLHVDQFVTETELLCSFPGSWKSKMQVM